MNDKKAAKKLIKLAKEHPDWYTKKDVYYAKMVKKQIKAQEKSQNDWYQNRRADESSSRSLTDPF